MDVATALPALLIGAVIGALAAHRACRAARIRLSRTAAAADARLAEREAQLRQLRHDLRGALSPALLSVDRLQASTDPAIVRTAAIVLRAIERAGALLDATRGGPERKPHVAGPVPPDV